MKTTKSNVTATPCKDAADTIGTTADNESTFAKDIFLSRETTAWIEKKYKTDAKYLRDRAIHGQEPIRSIAKTIILLGGGKMTGA